MNSKITITALLTVLLVALLFSACAPSRYRLVNEDGMYYAVIQDSGEESTYMGCEPLPEIYFDSIEEMKSDFLSGNFTDEELDKLAKISKSCHRGRIPLGDLDSLPEMTYPDFFTLSRVSIYPSGYDYHLLSDQSLSETCFTIILENHYDSYIKTYHEEFEILESYDPAPNRFDYYYDQDRDAHVFTYEKKLNDGNFHYIKAVLYSFTEGDRTYHVRESYYDGQFDVPTATIVMGKNETHFFYVDIELNQIIDKETIAQFNVIPKQD